MKIIESSQINFDGNFILDNSPDNPKNRSAKIVHIINKSPGNRWNHLELYDQKHLKIQYPQKILHNEEKVVDGLKALKQKEEELQQKREIQKLKNKNQTSTFFKFRQDENRRLYSRLGLKTGIPQNFCPIQINERLVNLSKSKTQFKPEHTNEYAEFRDIALFQLNSLDLIKNPTLINFLKNNKFLHESLSSKEVKINKQKIDCIFRFSQQEK